MGSSQPPAGSHPETDPPPSSFRDILQGPAPPKLLFSSSPPPLDIFRSGKHKGLPAITFSKSHVQRLSSSFQWALIGKFSKGYNKTQPHLGRPPVDQLQKYFESLDFKGTFQIGLMDNRHLFIQFHLQEDFLYLYSKPVWYVKGIPMRILKWSPQFHVDKKPPIAPVWIGFPRLPVHFFDRDSIFAIASLVGLPLRMDAATASLKRPSMARVQVELDLLVDRPPKVWIATDGEEGFWQKVDYENVPEYCQHCWHIGHSEQHCHIHHPELKSSAKPKNSHDTVVPKPPKQVYVLIVPQQQSSTQPQQTVDPILQAQATPRTEDTTAPESPPVEPPASQTRREDHAIDPEPNKLNADYVEVPDSPHQPASPQVLDTLPVMTEVPSGFVSEFLPAPHGSSYAGDLLVTESQHKMLGPPIKADSHSDFHSESRLRPELPDLTQRSQLLQELKDFGLKFTGHIHKPKKRGRPKKTLLQQPPTSPNVRRTRSSNITSQPILND